MDVWKHLGVGTRWLVEASRVGFFHQRFLVFGHVWIRVTKISLTNLVSCRS
jgi:hypothetical protein